MAVLPMSVFHSMYLGADVMGSRLSSATAEAIDAGVPEGAERME